MMAEIILGFKDDSGWLNYFNLFGKFNSFFKQSTQMISIMIISISISDNQL